MQAVTEESVAAIKEIGAVILQISDVSGVIAAPTLEFRPELIVPRPVFTRLYLTCTRD
jgi:hypothetical protein